MPHDGHPAHVHLHLRTLDTGRPGRRQVGGEDAIDRLIREESERFLARQPDSGRLIERSRRHLAGGATSNWQIADPQAVWMSHGAGSRIFDVDGTEYSDFHGGYGVSLAGHGHPAIVRAVTERVGRGTHFAQPTEDSIVVAEELSRRWGLPQWRFGNSGTESTMDAIHLMRVATGRDRLIKVEGCYHGHHDSVQVSVMPEEDEMGPADAPRSAPAGAGVPQAMVDLVDRRTVQRPRRRRAGARRPTAARWPG